MKRWHERAWLASAALSLACARSELWEPSPLQAGDGGSGGYAASAGTNAARGGGSAGSAGMAGAAGTANVGFEVNLTAGSHFSCARGTNGGVKCWGMSRYGSIGRGETKSRGNSPGELGASYADIDLGTDGKVVQLDAGGDHVCVVFEDGRLKCWGSNRTGELGLGDTDDRGKGPGEMGVNLPFVELESDEGPVVVGAISSGDHHTCARLREPAGIKCWGDNHGGQLGLGNTQFIGDEADEMALLSSVSLGAGAPATNVSAGYAHTCAVLTDGAVKCWGNNDYGQLGIGDTRRRGDGVNELGDNLKAVELGTRLGASSVVTGGSHTCAIRSDHRVTCWGANTFGQLGLGDTNHRGDGSDELGNELPPIDVGGSVGQVVAGDFHTCVLLSGGSVKCWGYGLYGQLGQGNSENIGDDPGELVALPAIDLGRGRTARELASGGYHVCAVLDDDSVKCWGANSYGQLGLGDTEHRGDEPGEMGDALPNVDLIFR